MNTSKELIRESESLLLKSRQLATHKQFEKAIVLLKKAQTLTPNAVVVHFYLGNIFAALEQWDEAINSFQKITQTLNPQHAESYNNLGRIFYKKKNFDVALENYEKAIQFYPSYFEAHFNLALLWMAQAQWTNAKRQLQKILFLKNNQIDYIYELLAQIALQEKNFEEALHFYTKRADFKKELSSQQLNNLGAIHTQLNNHTQAIDYFQQTLRLEPKHLEARNNLAALFLKENNLKESIWHYKLYLRLAPKDFEAHYNLGVAFMISGRLKESIQSFQTAIELRPEQGLDAWCNLGAVYLRMQKLQLAYDSYQKALLLDSQNEIAQFMIVALSRSSVISNKGNVRDLSIPSTVPLVYVRNLFDNYAPYFEKHLNHTLHYQVPQKLYQLVAPYLNKKNYTILDLGCGTGLSGIPFATCKETLVGVDISSKMLEKAKTKKIYNRLLRQDITSFLMQCNEYYDVIVSSDTLVYFGDLSFILKRVFEIANPGAFFLFSIEVMNSNQEKEFLDHNSLYYRLQSHGRYEHQYRKVLTLAQQYGWYKVDENYTEARLQDHQPVNAMMILLQKLIYKRDV